jgi:hypothetical protein
VVEVEEEGKKFCQKVFGQGEIQKVSNLFN